MVLSNQAGAAILRTHGATACTDLTGFGLLGHLVEMTRPSGVDAELQMSTLPLLDGGQFVLLLLEGVRGKPLPERFQMAFMQSGFVFLVGLSVVLIVKDTSQLPAVQQLLAR